MASPDPFEGMTEVTGGYNMEGNEIAMIVRRFVQQFPLKMDQVDRLIGARHAAYPYSVKSVRSCRQ